MFYVMHCGGIPFNGDTIKTKSLGGSESAAYYVARELVAQGHNVIIFTNSQDTGTFDGVKYEWAGNASESAPLGDRFTYYAENTPHDICIIQRHPRAFERKLASKINMLWLHDLAQYHLKDAVIGMMWNVDKVLCVSQYHKEQVMKVYGIPADTIAVINNGVDLALYDHPSPRGDSKYHMFYSSRPERGLINLVREGGIMDQLKGLNFHLHVFGYDNTTPQMEELYNMLWQRCDELPNVTNHGAVDKTELAIFQKQCSAWVYPTQFEEVSCITAMEAMAANCYIIASKVAAIPETCKGADTALIPLMNGEVDIERFVATILAAPSRLCGFNSLMAAEKFTWRNVASNIADACDQVFGSTHTTSLAHHFIRHSDIKAFEALRLEEDGTALRTELLIESKVAYKFYRENTYAEHYAKVYQREEDRGVHYGPEDVSGTTRFMAVAAMVAALPASSRVLDYGCAHGHYVVALAKRFPAFTFVGADISESNLQKASAWVAQEGLKNISFVQVRGSSADIAAVFAHKFDLIIAAEVIEHVGEPQEYIDELADNLADGGKLIITTPYGPWEAQGYREHGYWRAHLHHFERQDLLDMLGHHPNYKVVAAPSGMSMFHSVLGSYIVSFDKPTEPSRAINYERKLRQTMPDQTVSCCMIVKDAEQDILRCLKSVIPHVQEILIGLDSSTTDDTLGIIVTLANDNPLVAIKVIPIPPATETGFAAARNAVIANAAGDWVLWIDSDEVLMNGGAMSRFLRHSMYNGFAVKQHHFSHDPVGIIKVDLPCRLFRNKLGIKFFGLVHEHPELGLNEGLGPVSMMPVDIIHHGYTSEAVRRNRFTRNLPLLERDRKENPTRLLGKFLWLRDLAQSCQYDMEGGTIVDSVFDTRVAEGIALWEELLASKNYRIVIDALPYYSQLVMLRGGGLDFSFSVDATYTGSADSTKQPQIQGCFASEKHALALMGALAIDRIGDKDRRYL